jgi:hypothetical protein
VKIGSIPDAVREKRKPKKWKGGNAPLPLRKTSLFEKVSNGKAR